MKIGRNAPCWCGSPKKFKKCHGASDEPFTLQQSAEHIARPFSVRMCLRPEGLADECKGQIVRAHTIQRGGGLSRIADKGKVFTFMPGSWTTFIANAGKLKVRRVGIKDASTFTGFCERHDAAVFAPLEQKPFVGSPQQAFLLLYRAVCHEAYKKRAHAEALHVVEDQARRMGSDPGRRLAFLGRMGAMAGGQDLARMKQRLDEILLAGSYDTEIDFAAFQLSGAPEVVCAGASAPETDLEGRSLQDLSDRDATMSVMGFALIPTDAAGTAVFSWLKGEKPPRALVDSLLRVPSESLPSALVNYAFDHFENTYFSPRWWEG